MRLLYIILFASLFFAACKDEGGLPKKDKEVAQSSLESLPAEDFKLLYNGCTGIDYIFHELPISISQNDQPSVRANLNIIDARPIKGSLDGCKSIAREFFQVDGDVKYEAEIYFGDGCAYHVWMDGAKPIYANRINEEGQKFYNKLLTQTQVIQKQNGQ